MYPEEIVGGEEDRRPEIPVGSAPMRMRHLRTGQVVHVLEVTPEGQVRTWELLLSCETIENFVPVDR